jgi:hypothetical protein
MKKVGTSKRATRLLPGITNGEIALSHCRTIFLVNALTTYDLDRLSTPSTAECR